MWQKANVLARCMKGREFSFFFVPIKIWGIPHIDSIIFIFFSLTPSIEDDKKKFFWWHRDLSTKVEIKICKTRAEVRKATPFWLFFPSAPSLPNLISTSLFFEFLNFFPTYPFFHFSASSSKSPRMTL